MTRRVEEWSSILAPAVTCDTLGAVQLESWVQFRETEVCDSSPSDLFARALSIP
jgi:hypothetical protein